jgi:hypothetical protein
MIEAGPIGFELRIASALKLPMNSPELRDLSGAKSVGRSLWESLDAVHAVWFPNLAHEVARHRQGDRIETVEVELPASKGGAVPGGGWELDSANQMILYHSTGHGDPWLRAWLDVSVGPFSAKLPGDDDSRRGQADADDPGKTALRQFYDRLADPTSVHRCLDCHTVDRTLSDWKINWIGRRSQAREHGFEKFSHAPHARLMRCEDCHVSDQEVTFQHPQFWTTRGGLLISDNPETSLSSGFERNDKSLCAQCHNARGVGDNCLKCHNYHVGEFEAIRQ